MVAVPVVSPVTDPVVLTVATPGAVLLHAPPPTDSNKLVDVPVHNVADDGDMAAGVALTTMVVVTIQLPKE